MATSDFESASKVSGAQENLRLKMYPWSDWHEWAQVFHLMFSDLSIMKPSSASEDREIDLIASRKHPVMIGEEESGVSETKLKKALGKLTLWTSKNVAGDSSKYLKMQKLLLVQTLSLRRALQSND
jgi:hypothetical protein